MVFIIIGLLMAAGGAALLYFQTRTKDELLEVRSTKVSSVSDLNGLHQTIFDQIGAGGFSQLSEVRGKVEAAEPLRSDLAEVECVWHSSRVEERYEETYTETDSDGRSRTGTRSASEIVQSNTRSIPFLVRDTSGVIEVDPEGGRIDGDVVIDRHEPYDDHAGEIRVGAFAFRPSSGRRITGYQYHETAIPIGAEVYVIGDACDRVDGRLCIRKPTEKGKPFIISVRSEEEVVAGMEKSAAVKKWIGLGLIALGVVAVVWGVVNPG